VTEAEALELFQACSNLGRWGPTDVSGTLNFITEETRVRAAEQIRSGRTVSLAHELSTEASLTNTRPIELRMLDAGAQSDITCMDEITIACHGVTVTHLDAIGHMYFEGRMYNGRVVSEEVTDRGLQHADVMPLSYGIFTRGVILDIAAVHGVPYLDRGYGVTLDDLNRAEALSGTTVSTGDAIFVHTGAERREASLGLSPPDVRSGLTPECLPWLFEREIAIYSGDCTEQIPSGVERVPYPLHQVGFVAFGQVLLDNPRLRPLLDLCSELGRSTFAVTCAALPIPGATGSPVNPLALF
jgi:kynurenine formamidase